MKSAKPLARRRGIKATKVEFDGLNLFTFKMMETLLLKHWWFGIVLWITSSVSDYFLTIWGAALYARKAKQFVEIEGSYEGVPLFEADINSGNKISLRFFIVLVIGALAIGLLGHFRTAWEIDDELFLFAVGALVFVQVPIHLRHIRNIAGFLLMSCESGIRGKIEYLTR